MTALILFYSLKPPWHEWAQDKAI